ncbi:unnamed protein product [[Candida] boidinii]|nr:unnamed protein product [[Candida] boidinii]
MSRQKQQHQQQQQQQQQQERQKRNSNSNSNELHHLINTSSSSGGVQRRKKSIFLPKNTLLAKTVGKLPQSIINSNSTGINAKRRKISLTFIPPSTQSPLFVYNNNNDQRSFLSLCSGSHLDSGRESVIEDNESVSTFRSLPSTLEGSVEPDDDTLRWFAEEHQRVSHENSTEDFFNRQQYRSRYGGTDDFNISDDDGSSNNSDRNRRRTRHKSQRSNSGTGVILPGLLSTGEYILSEDESEEEEDFEHEVATVGSEIKMLCKYSAPLIATFFLEQAFSVVSVITVGHLGKQELAAVSMASMTSTIVLAIFEGVSTALDTLCPQAYGAGNFHAVGVHFQRCSAFSLALYIPIMLFLWYSGSLFELLLDDEEVIRLTQLFLRILILGGPPYILFENGKRFLQAQGIFDAGTIILFITAPINVLMNYLLVYNSTIGLGYIGAPIAAVINFWLMITLMYLYVEYIDGKECWGGFTSEAFTNWPALSKLAIPGIIMLEAESLAYECLTLLASYYGTEALATQSALSSTVSLLYMIPFAISVASSTRIANFVGSSNIQSAKVATNVGLVSSLVVALLNSFIILFGSKFIAHLFTEDQEIIDYFVSLCPLIAIFELFDGLACVASGILRALALQGIGGVINLLGYYVIAIPFAIYLGFTCQLELVGLWLANGSGLLLIGLTETYIILTANWNKIIEEAKLRNESDTYFSDDEV